MTKFLAAAIAALSLCAGARATATLDQSFLVDGSGSYSDIGIGKTVTGAQVDAMQTATAGLTGKLTGLKLQLFDDTSVGTVAISVITNVAIDPVTNVISGDQSAGIDVAWNALPTTDQFRSGDLLSVDTSGLNVFLTQGEAFGILVSFAQPPQTFGIGWGEAFDLNSPGYAGGDGYFVVSGAIDRQTRDLGFQTFVDPSQQPPSNVPEPESWMLMIGGFGAIGASMRSRRTRATPIGQRGPLTGR